MEFIRPYLLYLIAIILLQLLLSVVALIDLVRRPKVNGPKWIWVVMILFISFGPIAYFLLGRQEE